MTHRLSLFQLPLVLLCCGFFLDALTAHEGPDPVGHWFFNSRSLQSNRLKSRLGPDAKLTGSVKAVRDETGESLLLNSSTLFSVEQKDLATPDFLPRKAITVSSWFAVNQPREWGGVVGIIQDDGSVESGWVLGYSSNRFYFGLASKGADDGDGHMTYLHSNVRYEPGRMYHVVGVYDGQTQQIYVNGRLTGESKVQSGEILYPKSAPFTLGKYKDANEDFPHIGRIREIAIFDRAAKSEWVAKEFEHLKQLAAIAPVGVKPKALSFEIDPYLQFVTQTGITVMCQSSMASKATLHYGESDQVKNKIEGKGDRFIHELKISGLKPETQYFYQYEIESPDGKKQKSEMRTFQTANRPETPFSFAVISDTQSNPKVAKIIAEHAWGQRPNFLMHPGDLVGTGTNDSHWTQQYFPSMNSLVSRVAFFPVLGNHEVNARNYYDYMSLPTPEYYYTYNYGNTQFFMIDTIRKSILIRSSTNGSIKNWQNPKQPGRLFATIILPTHLMRMITATFGNPIAQPVAICEPESCLPSMTSTMSTSSGAATFTRMKEPGRFVIRSPYKKRVLSI